MDVRLASGLLLAVLTLAAPRVASAIGADSIWGPICGQVEPPSPGKAAWQLWSSPSTWNLKNGGIPGVGAYMGSNVTIPCGAYILLDVMAVKLELLDIQGTLRVKDSGPRAVFDVTAAFVIVQGNFLIGDKAMPFRPKIVFTLVDTPNKRPYVVTRPAIDGFDVDISLDNKVFAVVGGAVAFYGFPHPTAPAWTRLMRTAVSGSNQLQVRTSLEGKWPLGGKVIVTSSDYNSKQVEERDIVAINSNTITLSMGLNYTHFGGSVDTGLGSMIDEASEVALLTRNIVIQGEVDVTDPLIGGHFIVFKTQHPRGQMVDGVEFVNLGQQGRLGRYACHFHLARDVAPSQVTRCAVWQSNQRCYVTHGTHSLLLKDNVCYKSKGHGFLLEDGVEMHNTWDGNLAADLAPVERLLVSGPGGAVESDNEPSCFWVTNPLNTFVNNAAAGADSTGWWFQLSQTVLGPSARFPEAQGLNPRATKLLRFEGNTAHSSFKGFRSYPTGWKASNTPGGTGVLKNFRAWKHSVAGISFHRTGYVTIDGAQLADNLVGFKSEQDTGIIITNSIIVGETENYGNPKCNYRNPRRDSCPNNYCPQMRCGPISGCAMPVDSPSQPARSTAGFRYRKSAGILLTGFQGWLPLFPNQKQLEGTKIYNTKVAKFPNECGIPRACIILTSFMPIPLESAALAWLSTHSVNNFTCSGSPDVMFMPTLMEKSQFVEAREDQGAAGQYLLLQDEDGSITRSAPGYIVKNTPQLLAPAPPGDSKSSRSPCVASSRIINGMSCPRTCYRTVIISWKPTTAFPYNPAGPAAWRLTRASDGAVITLHHKVFPRHVNSHYVAVSLLTGQTYKAQYILQNASGVVPPLFAFGFMGGDIKQCDGGITLQFAAPMGQHLTLNKKVVTSPCVAATTSVRPMATTSAYTCLGGRRFLQVSIASQEMNLLNGAIVPGIPGCRCF